MGDFKHIAVTAAEEDDVVIQAGVCDAQDAPENDEGSPVDANGRQDGEEAPSVPSRSQAAKPAKKDGYHETTLEDLQPSPMPTTQKIVIIAAIICIIGALVYCIAFMR